MCNANFNFSDTLWNQFYEWRSDKYINELVGKMPEAAVSQGHTSELFFSFTKVTISNSFVIFKRDFLNVKTVEKVDLTNIKNYI